MTSIHGSGAASPSRRPAAVVTTVLVAITVGSELPRWRWLLARSGR